MSKLNVTIEQKKIEDDFYYPCLRISEQGRVVLFTASSCGTELKRVSGETRLGHYAKDWNMSCFTSFHGSITLTQE